MKLRTILLAILAMPLSAMAQPADNPKAAPNPKANGYATLQGFFKMPAGRAMGASSAVAGDTHGNIWMVDRCAANSCVGSKLAPVMQFDRNGKFIKAFGGGMMQFPHGFLHRPQRSSVDRGRKAH